MLLRGKVYDEKPEPAAEDADGRVGADEHEWEELVSFTENQTVYQGAVQHERDGNCYVEQ